MPIAQRVVTEFIGRPVDMSFLEARPRHPDGESVRVVVSTGRPAAAQLEAGCSAELCSEHDDDIVEQAALLQVLNQASDRSIDSLAELGVVGFQVLVGVPGAVRGREDLDEPDTAFHQSACRKQPLPGDFGGVVIEAVQFRGGLGFVGKRDRFGHGRLHPEGQFVRSNASPQRLVLGILHGGEFIQAVDRRVLAGLAFE